MRCSMAMKLTALASLVLATFAWAADPPPVPKSVAEARSVFVFDQTGNTAIYDNVYDKLRKWGRWTMAEDPSKADLVAVIAAQNIFVGSTTTVTASGNGSATQIGNTTMYGGQAQAQASTMPNLVSMPRYLGLIDPKTGRVLLSVSCEQRLTNSYTAKVLVDRLRKRFPKSER